MQKSVGIRELKQNPSAVVREVKSGSSLTITEHGEPVAMMIPYPADLLLRLELSGQLVRPKAKFDFSSIEPKAATQSIQDLIDSSREERF
jgi:prevent-host-death family protein